jgi:NNP family nitrate/nitrite transporter-like MFS transporter
MNSPLIHEWNPEDRAFWEQTGQKVAQRNLIISIFSLTLSFIIWMAWSSVVVKLPAIGFAFSTDQLFWLAALPGLSGATLRIFYSFAVGLFGGRNWTIVSTASLLIPAISMGLIIQNPASTYGTFVIVSLLCGFGGANFASSMANIGYFYPRSRKGTALGLNAGLGNLGVSIVQFVTPLVITSGCLGSLAGSPQSMTGPHGQQSIWLQNAALFWVPFMVVTVFLAWWGMNNLAVAKASFADQAVIFKEKHTWLLCVLYTATFGSFIGFSAGLTLLMKTIFPSANPLQYSFIGPLVGASLRPVGGWLADRLGGARVTFWNFVAMTGLVVIWAVCLGTKSQPGSFPLFLSISILLFAATGLGNGSVFRMVPPLCLGLSRKYAKMGDAEQTIAIRAGQQTAATTGFISAIAAYGAFFIPKFFGYSMNWFGEPQPAFYALAGLYLVSLAITWWFYQRRGAEFSC